MTRKDYQMIANTIKSTAAAQSTVAPTLRCFALNLSVELKKDNPNFKPALFLKACGV